MSRELVRRWYSRLPPHERDLPIIILNGVAYTPRMILEEVERGTPTGDMLQEKLERGQLGTTAGEVAELAKIRLIEILRRYPQDVPLVASLSVNPRPLTPRELIEEIERGTRLGRMLVEAEVRHMIRLITLR